MSDSHEPATNLEGASGDPGQVPNNPQMVPSGNDQQVTGDNGQTPTAPARWQGGFKPEYRGHELLSGMENMNHLFEAYQSAHEQLEGVKGRVIPGEGATDDDWGAFRKAMGVPDSKDGYEFEYPEDMDKNDLDGMANWIRDIAHEQGLPKNVTSTIFTRWANDLKAGRQAQHDAAVAKKQADLMELSKGYGKEWDSTLSSTKTLAKQMFGEDGYAALEQANMLDNPVVLKSLIGLKGRVSEDTLPQTAGVTGTGGETRESKAASLFPETKSYG